jgi:hypothetical protein
VETSNVTVIIDGTCDIKKLRWQSDAAASLVHCSEDDLDEDETSEDDENNDDLDKEDEEEDDDFDDDFDEEDDEDDDLADLDDDEDGGKETE